MTRVRLAATGAWLIVLGVLAWQVGLSPAIARAQTPATPACDQPAAITVRPLAPGEPYAAANEYADPVIVKGTIHPVSTAQTGLAFLIAGNRDAAQKMLDLERAAAVQVDGFTLLPYRFDFATEGIAETAPWYSAMAQGQVLSLAVRLGDRDMVARLLPSLIGPSPVTRRVPTGLWLEEYPQGQPDPVLNGGIFAAYGLYDEWMATGSTVAHDALVDAISAVRADLTGFRDPGRTPWYDLKHAKRISAAYGPVYAAQMATLAAMTGDECFTQMGAAFASDLRAEPAS